ncbi:hypothetical protein ACJJTC_016549 [Scirpophaga incertulas]
MEAAGSLSSNDEIMRRCIPVNVIEFHDKTTKFSRWLERLEGAFSIYNVTDINTKKSYLLHYVGAQTYDLLCDLLAPNEPKNTPYNVLKETLQEHYDPTPVASTPTTSRKRHIRKHDRKDIKRKYLKNLGKAYVCKKGGTTRDEKVIKPPCPSTCRLKCFEKITLSKESKFFMHFGISGTILDSGITLLIMLKFVILIVTHSLDVDESEQLIQHCPSGVLVENLFPPIIEEVQK